MNLAKNNPVLLTLLATLIACIFLTAQFSWRGPDRKGYTHVIDSDGKGYYMYLPSIFIQKNLASLTPDDRYVFKTTSGAVNKYFAGTAIAMLPFFGGGYITAALTHKPLTGYSPPFQRAISIAAWAYLGLGLLFLAGLLILYNIRTELVCITLIAIVFGTNLLMYAVYHPSFSHVYSFCFVAMFLYYAKRVFTERRLNHALLLAFALGMIVIIRPTNGLIILALPFIAGSWEVMKDTFKAFLNYRLIAVIAVFAGIVSIQLILWHIQTGSFFVQSYKHEGFYFAHPEVLNTLFSFRKGFFLYTPLAAVSLCGLIIVAKKSRFQLYSLLLFFLFLVYITASWWNWYYGPSFGQRPFVEFYPLNAVLLALLLSSLNKLSHRRAFYSFIGLLLAFNLLQSFQYVKNIISPWDMNFEKYKYTFLRTAPKYYSCLGGNNDIIPYPGVKNLLLGLKNDYEKRYPYWAESELKAVGGDHKNVADFTELEFNSACDIKAGSSIANHRLLYAEIGLEKLELNPAGSKGPLIGIVVSDAKGTAYTYSTFGINEIPTRSSGHWKAFNYHVELPKVRKPGDVIRVYIWNKTLQPFYIDNFQVRLYGID
ncbi:MAG: hypothetical protein JWO44_545 [Bacteroidetes bacterium]|nr:hypothetical protein [Bacteroidota bacterium]